MSFLYIVLSVNFGSFQNLQSLGISLVAPPQSNTNLKHLHNQCNHFILKQGGDENLMVLEIILANNTWVEITWIRFVWVLHSHQAIVPMPC
jgi:hypothetical protein